jgi:hypothetical protein
LFSALVAFIVTLIAVTGLQTERGHYRRIHALTTQMSGSTAEVAAALKQVSNRTTDPDLKIVAEYESTIFAALSDQGMKNMVEVATSGFWDAFIMGGLNGYINPLGAIRGLLKDLWLLKNESEFHKAEARADKRYGGFSIISFVLAGIVSWATYALVASKRSWIKV